MKLIELLAHRDALLLREKKEAVGEVPLLNLTFHLNHTFHSVGDSGKPELNFTISISSTGGKDFARIVGDEAEKDKFRLAVKHELQKAVARLNKNMKYIVKKYNLQPKAEEKPEQDDQQL